MALNSPEMRSLYDLKVFVVSTSHLVHLVSDAEHSRTAIPTSCLPAESSATSRNAGGTSMGFWTRFVLRIGRARSADAAHQYLRFVKSSYDNFVQPSSRYADVVGP
jgi:hypothetical protein